MSNKLSKTNADAEFFTSEASSLFINGTFGAFTLLGANFPNPPIYPMASPGVRFALEPVKDFYFQAGVFAGDSGSQGQNLNGLNHHLNARDGVQIYEGELGSLKRFKDDVREVREGFECGLGVHGFNDLKVGDRIECYRVESVARTLAGAAGAEAN